ncbi:MAG: response regulator [Beijerinckiaceae bacterium]|jgi:CheY-like chemotaxis protein
MPQLNARTAPHRTPVRILVAEDEPFIRHAIAEELRTLGVFVIEAATACEAWDYFTGGGQADLVFTDHQMPGEMTGAELAVRINSLYPSLKIILTSGSVKAQDWSGPVLRKPYLPGKTATGLVELALRSRPNGTER